MSEIRPGFNARNSSCGKVMFLHLSVIMFTMGAVHPPETATGVDDTHPTGMHSRLYISHITLSVTLFFNIVALARKSLLWALIFEEQPHLHVLTITSPPNHKITTSISHNNVRNIFPFFSPPQPLLNAIRHSMFFNPFFLVQSIYYTSPLPNVLIHDTPSFK